MDVVHFKSERGDIDALEREELLLDPIMSEPLLMHRERGKRIVRRRREEGIAQRKHWGSFATDKSRRALGTHIQLTEDLSIRKFIHMHQYWDVEESIFLDLDRGQQLVMDAHDGEETGEENRDGKNIPSGSCFYEHSKWLFLDLLGAVDDEWEAGQVRNYSWDDEILRAKPEKWDSWIKAIQDEYIDFQVVLDSWENADAFGATRGGLEEEIEDQDRYESELAWAQGGIFGPYLDHS